jgi:hypothetical protein
LESDGWHIDYEIAIHLNGGAPHYIICPETGEITYNWSFANLRQ